VARHRSFDVIVVGGGTAGCVIAHRLSSDPTRSVLLIEGGPDYPADRDVPSELLDVETPVTSTHTWGLQASIPAGRSSASSIRRMLEIVDGKAAARTPAEQPDTQRTVAYPLGRIMGGCSAINAALAFPPERLDFDRWGSLGLDEWTWSGVEPSWAKVLKADTQKHALPMLLPDIAALTKAQSAFSEACRGLDSERRQRLVARNLRPGGRASSAWIYLSLARERPNLTIMPGTYVNRILFESQRGDLSASGVEVAGPGKTTSRILGRDVILCAGAIQSPAILMRSGIGDEQVLRRAGITALLHLPRVGAGLRDHPSVTLWAVPRTGVCQAGEPVHQVALESSSATGAPGDSMLLMLSAVPTNRFPPLETFLGSALAMGISVLVTEAHSEGRVTLRGPGVEHVPNIALNLLSDRRDVCAIVEGTRLAWRILSSAPLRSIIQQVVGWNDALVDSTEVLEKTVRAAVRPSCHATGTLRMGHDSDATAVVDQQGRVRGCSHIVIGDASVMPIAPSIPPSLMSMTIAEKIADQFLS